MPFQSKRQMRAAFGGHIPGISKEKAREWAKETPDLKDLPERAPGEKGKPTLLSKGAAEEKPQEGSAALSAAGVLGGSYALGSAKPLITGRTRLYHGTTADIAKKIQEQGLLPAAKVDSPAITDVLPNDIRAKAKDLVYLSPVRAEAGGYAGQADFLRRFGKNWQAHQKERLDATVKGQRNPFQKGIVAADVPLWRSDVAALLRKNPEARGSFEEYKKGLGLRAIFKTDHELGDIYNSLDRAVGVEGGLAPEFIRGGSKFKGVTAKEVMEYAKANPKRFATGVGLGLLGAAGLGLGAHQAYKLYQSKTKQSQLAHGSDSGSGLPEKAVLRGQKVEMEHTKNPATARQIAIDHLRERPDYYARLAEAEKSAALSPTALTALQHGGIGAGAGALIGAGIGAARATPENRGSGALKGALTGAGIGFAGGAGGSLLRNRVAAPSVAPKAVSPTSPTMPAISARPYGPVAAAKFPTRSGPFQISDPSELYHLEQQGWKLGPKDVIYPPGQDHLRTSAITERFTEPPVKLSADTSELEARLNQMQAEKAHEDRISAIANHFDHLGLGVLASPYIADAAEKATKNLMLRGGKLGRVGAELHTGAQAAQHFLHAHPLLVEGGGLALVAPGVTHRLAKAVDRFRPGSHQPMAPSVPEQPQAASDMRAMSSAAEKVGRLLAHPAPQEKVAINVGGVANWAWKNRKPLAGAAALAGTGAALYGAKKGIDTVSHMATAPREPARYVGAPPGMRPPTPAYTPIGS